MNRKVEISAFGIVILCPLLISVPNLQITSTLPRGEISRRGGYMLARFRVVGIKMSCDRERVKKYVRNKAISLNKTVLNNAN